MMRFLLNSIILIMFTYGCGFKVIKQSDLIDFYISQIETVGDKKINYSLKNKLIFKASNENNKQLDLNIITKKEKLVKEKNSSNEITKYEINIQIRVNVNHKGKQIGALSLKEQIDYNVSSQYSQTINNENQAIKTLTNGLVDKIIKELSLLDMDDL